MQEPQETWVRSLGQEDPPRGWHGGPLLYSCLESSMDRGTWWATAYGVAKSQTQLSDLAHTQTQTHTHILDFVYWLYILYSLIYIKKDAFLKKKVEVTK